MDVFIAMLAGLGFRLFLNNLDGPLTMLTPVILGLCESALVHYLPRKTSSFDHYLAYGLRIVIDLLFTENVSRMVLVLLWTALSVVASNALKLASHHERKRSRRYTITRTPTTHTPRPQRLAIPPPFNPPLTHSPLQQPHTSNPSPITPLQNPNRPPSPPSYFLEGESETNISPTSEQLEYGPGPTSSPSNSSSPNVILLPTPPPSLIPDAQQSDTLSLHRLSTIQELSGDESGNLDKTDTWTETDHARPAGAHIAPDRAKAEYAPSVATSAPLPVPNATYIRANWSKTVFDNDDSDPSNSPSASISAPLPVPNAAIRSQRSEWKMDSASEPDELRTPGAHYWEITDQDELRTPAAPQKELSPLFSDQPLPVGFGVTGEVQSTVDDIAPLPVPAVDPGISNVPSSGMIVMSTLLNSSVECFPKAVNDHSPDLDELSEAETLQSETDATSVMSSGNSKQLFSRGEFFRLEARKEEKQRSALENELRTALKESRIRDTLFLREDIRLLEERVKNLHEKAARRFFKGKYIIHPFIKGSFDNLP